MSGFMLIGGRIVADPLGLRFWVALPPFLPMEPDFRGNGPGLDHFRFEREWAAVRFEGSSGSSGST